MPKFTNLTICLALLLTAASAASAQEWKKTADLGLALTQSGYSDSWAGGESGSITWAFNGNLTAERNLNDKTNWLNTLKLQWGQTHTQDAVTKDWAKPEKSSDRIFLESLVKFDLGFKVDPYAAVTLETQFSDKSDPSEDKLIYPRLFTESAGFGRKLIAEETRTLFSRVGFAVRQRSFFDGMEHSTVKDGGLEWVTDHQQTFSEGSMKVVNKLRVFQAVVNSESDTLGDEWKSTDLAFESAFSASISKYIQMTVFAEWLYDEEITTKGRFRETIGLGLAYKLF